jgi:hypothetical protein
LEDTRDFQARTTLTCWSPDGQRLFRTLEVYE